MKTFAKIERGITLSFFSIFLFAELSAQITIGMGEAPARAGLLQIKDQEPDLANVTSTKGGLILPRVSLVNLQTLEPFVSTSDANYEAERGLHVGLIVYNMTNSGSIIPGLYFWDGNEWNILKATDKPTTSGNPQSGAGSGDQGRTVVPETEVPTNTTSSAGLKLANTYVVNTNKVLVFPVIKAYSVWVQLLNLNEVDLAGSVTTELLWQDTKNLITSVSLNTGDRGSLSEIKVETNNAGLEGNAVVVVKINNIIRWSWYIWVTSYDPNSTANQKTYNSTTFMDRNLGATDASYGNIGALGLLFQWGRKDPFPGSAITSPAAGTERPLYNITNDRVNFNKVATSGNNNLATSVRNPFTFYLSSSDWYSTNSSSKNDNLWNNTNGTKATFDPCPKGWRTPAFSTGETSVWKDLGAKIFDEGKGADWGTAGYYPAAGYREPSSGNLKEVGVQGYVWAGTPRYGNGFRLYFETYHTATLYDSVRATGASVRCVKE